MDSDLFSMMIMKMIPVDRWPILRAVHDRSCEEGKETQGAREGCNNGAEAAVEEIYCDRRFVADEGLLVARRRIKKSVQHKGTVQCKIRQHSMFYSLRIKQTI